MNELPYQVCPPRILLIITLLSPLEVVVQPRITLQTWAHSPSSITIRRLRLRSCSTAGKSFKVQLSNMFSLFLYIFANLSTALLITAPLPSSGLANDLAAEERNEIETCLCILTNGTFAGHAEATSLSQYGFIIVHSFAWISVKSS